MNRMRIFVFYWVPVILYCGLIFYQSSNPVPEKIPSLLHMDKILHFTAYGILGALFFRAFRRSGLKFPPLIPVFLSIICAGAYGISDEIHQSFVAVRTADINDVLADVAGSTLGVLCLSSLAAWWEKTDSYLLKLL